MAALLAGAAAAAWPFTSGCCNVSGRLCRYLGTYGSYLAMRNASNYVTTDTSGEATGWMSMSCTTTDDAMCELPLSRYHCPPSPPPLPPPPMGDLYNCPPLDNDTFVRTSDALVAQRLVRLGMPCFVCVILVAALPADLPLVPGQLLHHVHHNCHLCQCRAGVQEPGRQVALMDQRGEAGRQMGFCLLGARGSHPAPIPQSTLLSNCIAPGDCSWPLRATSRAQES
jgi:hypothetical protein